MSFFLLIWSLSTLGLFSLAASMSKHQKQMFHTELSAAKSKIATILGWTLLMISLLLCISDGAYSNMISYWLGTLTFAALVVGLSLSYMAEKTKIICVGYVVLSLVSAVIVLV